MVNNPRDTSLTEEEPNKSSFENNEKEEKKEIETNHVPCQNLDSSKQLLVLANNDNLCDTGKVQCDNSSDSQLQKEPVLCNGVHDAKSEESIPNTNDCDELSLNETNANVAYQSSLSENDEIKQDIGHSTRMEQEETTATVDDQPINFNDGVNLLDKDEVSLLDKDGVSLLDKEVILLDKDEVSLLDEKIVVNDTRQSELKGIFDDILSEVLCSTNSDAAFNEKTSQPLTNTTVNNLIDSETTLGGKLIDIQLSDNLNTSGDLDNILSNDLHNELNTETIRKGDNEKTLESIDDIFLGMQISSELSNSEKLLEPNLNTDEARNKPDENPTSENNEKSNADVIEDIQKPKEDLIPQESINKSNEDRLPNDNVQNSTDFSNMDVQKSNKDLKEKIGNSIKSMFDNNEHLNLNLLEKQNIANLQSNTLKKVNNLFSTFKSYNFSNFRNNEENLSKEKMQELSSVPKTGTVQMSTLQNKGLAQNELETNSSSPQQNDQNDSLVNKLNDNSDLKTNAISQHVPNSDTSEITPVMNKLEHVQSDHIKSNAKTVDNLVDKIETYNIQDNELVKSRVQDNFICSEVKPELKDNFVLNTDLIHTVRNAAHVKNKSISLNSSPVRNIAQHEIQDELYLLKETNIRLLGEISWLEEEKNKMKKDFRTYIEETELFKKSMNEQILQHEQWKEQNRLVQEAEARSFALAKKDLETKLDKLKKEFGVANKEREASVMRYVTKESELITARQDREAAEKKYKEAMKEKDNVIAKLKVLSTDKARLTQLYDDKCTEYNILQRSLDKVSDEIAGKDVKLKWVQSKLDKEIETNRQLSDRLQAVEEKQASQVEEASRLKFSEDSQRLFLQEIDVLKKKNQAMTEENNALSLKVQKLEKERLESDESLSKCKSVVNSQNETISGLKNQLANMEDLKNQLHVEHERLLAKDTEVDRVQKSNSELSQDMATCRAREAELLQFTEKLTAKNVRLQSEFSALEAKAEKLEKDVQPLTAQVKLLEEEIASLQSQLGAEKQAKDGDNKALARLVAEKTKQLDQAAKEIEELKSENQIMKRKHASNIRELNKELATLKKKCETYSSGDALGDTHTLGYGSRTSSCQSLNEVQHSPTSASIASTLSSTLQMEPDRNVIIERLVELQRSHAKTIEKMEFLEEHNAQLVNELQKKTKILQNYILREQSGALTSRSMDVNKAEVTRHGGIMASLYSSKPTDGGMTLELSLEINRKLQAVLEDTILKNITLKENIDTLGEQIEKLSKKS
ncbi:hypothetical protein M8J77_006334 [Diaphorina citri]|nr:hypothetical protein M8J77_006334 [Diaphorina citri]